MIHNYFGTRYTDIMNTYEHTYDSKLNGLFGSWEGPAIGLLDLDAFFASVEQLDHPEWRGKPVIVGGSPSRRGVVSTASYEARAFGVHSAMSSAQAKSLCPQAIWTPGHFNRYRELSAQVIEIIASETPFVEQVSIDEAFFDVTPGSYAHESPIAICQRISKRVSMLGISCSIGLGPNKTTAKIASERDKPHGLTIVMPGTQKAFLAPLPVRTMSGIGAAAEKTLHAYGIRTLGQLGAASAETLQRAFGANAECMRSRALGCEQSSVKPFDAPEEIKSISNERTFAQDLTKLEDAKAAVRLLAESVGTRLRNKQLAGNVVTLKLAYAYGEGRTIQRKMPHPTDDENIFGALACQLLESLWTPAMHLRLIGVGVSGFKHDGGIQTDLFCEVDDRGAVSSDKRDLSIAVDAVRNKFGLDAVGYGRAKRFEQDLIDPSKHLNNNTPR